MKAGQIVAWNLRRIRVQRGLSQEALAVDSEVDRTYVSRLERSLENPTVAVLERLAVALDVPLADFFVAPKTGASTPRTLPSGRRKTPKYPRK